MTTNLWSPNHPRNFWMCEPPPSDDTWQAAIAAALPGLGLSLAQPDMDAVLALILGEGRFGPDHWSLSLSKRVYYLLKPVLPRRLTRMLRRAYHPSPEAGEQIQWPIEPRYVAFVWQVLAEVTRRSPGQHLNIRSLWPEGRRFALVLTHDVESKTGLQYVRHVADLEESLGFRSSFNFVPEDYPLDMLLVDELCDRGFEVGIHGLKHDGRLFNSRSAFEKSAARINEYLRKTRAAGFRSPLTIRHPEWMQCLDVDYDLSFFDTDPFEPIPGGTMSIWPFFTGRFVELPYTLVQDYTLTDVLKQDGPRIWLEKVQFIRENWGMALVNSHPDYLLDPMRFGIYSRFLQAMREEQDAWNALPRQMACWWRTRGTAEDVTSVALTETALVLTPHRDETPAASYPVSLRPLQAAGEPAVALPA
jgi:hypothetical protein